MIPLNNSGFLMIPSTIVLVILRMNEWMLFGNCIHDPQTTYTLKPISEFSRTEQKQLIGNKPHNTVEM